jgi:hypothetical protein
VKKKKITIITMILTGCFLFTLSLTGASGGMETLFPHLNGWTQKGKIDTYTPDTLYEYINGAADVFLGYDFRELASATFEDVQKASFTVDIYLHNNPTNGFGIYSAEKPPVGPFIPIGTQGYYEKGVLNFLKGSYYVKISGFDLGEQDESVLKQAARQVAQKLEGENRFPQTMESFPGEGKIPHSERYIARNFLGHSFLHSAFTADYDKDGRPMQVFLMEADDEKDARKIIDSYLNFVKGKGMKVETPAANFHRFQDPYYRSSGMMHMKQKGKYVWGLFCKSPSAADMFIKKIENNLVKFKLINR